MSLIYLKKNQRINLRKITNRNHLQQKKVFIITAITVKITKEDILF